MAWAFKKLPYPTIAVERMSTTNPRPIRTCVRTAGPLPLLEHNAPERAEDDDAGHVERPTGELVFAHLCLAHAVEEELHVPDHAREGGEQVVGQQRDGSARRRRSGDGGPVPCWARLLADAGQLLERPGETASVAPISATSWMRRATYWCADRFLTFKATHQRKLVVEAPEHHDHEHGKVLPDI